MAKTDPPATDRSRRDLLLGLIALFAFVGLSVGALFVLNPSAKVPDPLKGADLPTGEAPIDLTLVHTNDTWGYLSGCG
jgi:hypothetical protein